MSETPTQVGMDWNWPTGLKGLTHRETPTQVGMDWNGIQTGHQTFEETPTQVGMDWNMTKTGKVRNYRNTHASGYGLKFCKIVYTR